MGDVHGNLFGGGGGGGGGGPVLHGSTADFLILSGV